MAEEQSQLRGRPSAVPPEYSWPSLLSKDGDELETHYRHTLEELGQQGGMLGLIFRKAQNKIQDPAKLRRLIVDLIDREQWSSISSDVKGDAYEGLLEKNAADVKGGLAVGNCVEAPALPRATSTRRQAARLQTLELTLHRRGFPPSSGSRPVKRHVQMKQVAWRYSVIDEGNSAVSDLPESKFG